MGAFTAFAYLAKGSALVLVPPWVANYVLWRLTARPRGRWMPRDRRFLMGVCLSFLLLVPWFVRNAVHFGDPLYTTQNHAAGYIGWKSWEEGTYTLYWGERPPPSLRDKAADPARWIETSREFAKRHLWWLFVRLGAPWGEFDPKESSTYGTGFPALLGIVLWGLAGVVAATRRLFRRQGGRLWRWLQPFFRPEYALFLLVGAAYVGFLSVCWEPIDRLVAPLIPLVTLMGWATVWTIVRGLFGERPLGKVGAGLLVVGLWALWAKGEYTHLRAAEANSGYPWREADIGWQETGDYIRTHLPGSVTMTRNPWELHFYSDEKAIQIPLAPLERIIEVARYYGATHLIPEKRRPTLQPWVDGEVPGLTRVFASHGVELYAINYRALPPHLIRPIVR